MIIFRNKISYLSVLFIGCICLLLYFIKILQIPSHSLARYHFLYFGTTIQITLGHNQNKLSNTTIAKIDSLLENLHYKWHPWREGELKQLNIKLKSLQPFTANNDFINSIKLAQKFYDLSLGYFNPTIGKLIAYWGFHHDAPSATNSNFKINLTDFKKNLPNPHHIKIDYNIIQNTNSNLQLDLSGFIKADAALKIKKILLDKHIKNALINIGGDIYVMGTKSDQPWIIATNISNKNLKLIAHNNETIATSGINARNYTEHQHNKNKLRHHIINPKTAEPAEGFIQVTVIHEDPFLSDAAATALLIAGEKDYEKIAKSMGISKYILVNKTNIIVSDNIRPYIYHPIN